MNTLEDRLQTAMRAAGETVVPDSVPPLRLPAPPWWRAGRWPGRPFWHGWLVPLATAASVAAVLALLQAVALVVSGGGGTGDSVASARGIPPYYVVLSYRNPDLGGPLGAALVRETVTGKLLRAVKAPGHGRFTAVTAAADQHTFILAARVAVPPSPQANVLRFFRLGLSKKATATRLSQLPLKVSPDTAFLTGLALSPDGTRLAMSLTVGVISQIRVVSLVTGRSRTWSGISQGRHRARPYGPWIGRLSWAADDQTLAYNDASNVRILDTAATGASLKLDSLSGVSSGGQGIRIAESCAPLPQGSLPDAYFGNALLSADGHLVIATSGYQGGRSAIATIPRALWQSGSLSYPCRAPGWQTVTSQIRRIHYRKQTGEALWIYWVSPTADSMIVGADFRLGGRGGIVGILRGNKFTPLPGNSRIPITQFVAGIPAAW